MVVSSHKYIVAVDCKSMTPKEISGLRINEKLEKLLALHPSEGQTKIVVLWDEDELDQGDSDEDSFMSKICTIPDYNKDIVYSMDMFIFKLGIYIGQEKHIVWYTNKSIDLISVIGDEASNFQDEESKSKSQGFSNNPRLGSMTILPPKKLSSFKFSTILKIEDSYNERYFPEYAKLEELTNIKGIITDILQKLWKQMKNNDKMEWIKFAKTCQNLISQHLTSMKPKPHNDYDCKNYIFPRVLDELISNNIIDSPVIEILLSNHIYHAKRFIDGLTVQINTSKFKQEFGTSNKLLEDEVGSKFHENSKYLDNSESDILSQSHTRDETEITDNVNSTINDHYDEDSCAYNNYLDTQDSRYIQPLCKLGIDKEFAERLFKWFILAFLIKYEQASYENIKKLTKFENALINFVKQQFESKKFNKLYGEYADVLQVDIIAKIIINFLVDRKCILVSDSKIEHYEDRFREEKELFDQYV